MTIFDFEKLEVWQDAKKLVKEIYLLTNCFPKSEQFGIISQLRKSALSVSLNIAEGKGRYHKKEFIQFLYLARGSLYETIALIKIIPELNLANTQQTEPLLISCRQILSKLSGLINYLKEFHPRAKNLEPRTKLKGAYHA